MALRREWRALRPDDARPSTVEGALLPGDRAQGRDGPRRDRQSVGISEDACRRIHERAEDGRDDATRTRREGSQVLRGGRRTDSGRGLEAGEVREIAGPMEP